MKCVITCIWRSTHTVDWPEAESLEDIGPIYLNNFPDSVLEELTPQNAELIGWEVCMSKKQ